MILFHYVVQVRTGTTATVVLQTGNMDWGAALIFCRNAKITATFVQMATLRTCGDYLCGGVVSAIFAVLS
jgi:hypothetical protein